MGQEEEAEAAAEAVRLEHEECCHKNGRFYADKRLLRRSDSEDFEQISASIDLAQKR